jgi:hypothetical protein
VLNLQYALPFTWEKSLHTNTRCMSWASYFHYYVCRVIFVYVILVYQLHVCIILTCSLTDFSDRYTCVSYYNCEEPNLVAFLFSVTFSVHVGLIFRLYYSIYPGPSKTVRRSNFVFIFFTLFTLCPFVTKRVSNFYLDRECISKLAKWFLSQNG